METRWTLTKMSFCLVSFYCHREGNSTINQGYRVSRWTHYPHIGLYSDVEYLYA